MIDSWKCHICGKTRPDRNISVLTKPLIIDGVELGEQNIRYCNDDPDCCEKLQTFSFIKN